jgi:sterol desaturase/sphingolipid hydroxylase (fatty acid hydroxylase superfamily)
MSWIVKKPTSIVDAIADPVFTFNAITLMEMTKMEDILHALSFVLIAGAAFMVVILVEAAYLRRQGKTDAYNWRESIANISTGFMYKMVDGAVVAIFVTHFYDDVVKLGLQYKPANKWLGMALLFFVTDLLFYVAHVAMHKLRYAWCSHITHHSSVRYNFSTALRQNFLFDLSGLVFVWTLPMALIGFDKMSMVVAIELNLFYQFFVHTETIKRLPAWYEAVFNTPSHHRVHHGRNPAQIDTNFGGVLIIWDRLFGTFVDERDAGKIVYGISMRQPTTLNPLRLNLDEWFAMWGDVWRHKDLRILWKHPDWVETQYPKQKQGHEALLN